MLSKLIEMLKHMGLAIGAMLTHAIIGLSAITIAHYAEKYIVWLTGGHAILLFNKIPLSWVIQGGELGLLIGIMVFGTMAAINVLRRHE